MSAVQGRYFQRILAGNLLFCRLGKEAGASDVQRRRVLWIRGALPPRRSAAWSRRGGLQLKVQSWHGRRSVRAHGIKVPSSTTENCASGEHCARAAGRRGRLAAGYMGVVSGLSEPEGCSECVGP